MSVVQQDVTREVFLNFSPMARGVFYALAIGAMGIFTLGVVLKVRKYMRGKPERRLQHLWHRLVRAVGQALGQTTVGKRHWFVGLAHGLIMWGFIALFIGTAILTVDADIVPLVNPAWHFFHGAFYRWYSVILDVFGVAFLVGLVFMGLRRGAGRPQELDYRRPDLGDETRRGGFRRGDWLFVGLLLFLGVTGFILEGLRIAGTGFPPFERWSPVGWGLAGLFDRMGWGLATHKVTWWVHGIAALGFVAYLPFSKGVHLLVDAFSIAFKDPLAGRRLTPPIESTDHVGQRDLTDFTWKQLLDFDACTKCGRCHVACPARASGAPLSPRDLILDLRQHADAAWSRVVLGHERRSDLVYGDADITMAGQVISADTLWACTTCLACVEVCPVGIEHVPTIVGMRRSLVDQGEIEPGLQDALMALGKQGNSFGKSARMRAKWAKKLPFTIKDARKEPVEVLWFVGDYASYDEQVRDTTIQVAHVFQEAGLDFGLLYEGERNSGNDVRRVGEEGLFEVLAEQNIEQLAQAEFKEIVTTDPHSLNALRNEYPAMGASYTVRHYTELLVRLIESGALKVQQPILRRVTFHDPCYLSRYNKMTEWPRRLLELLGANLVEMPRHGTNSFCCGAGGGRIWMDDSTLTERPSEIRIREAIELDKVTDFIVSCPKDLTMFRAAVAATGYQEVLTVRDITELVCEAVGVEMAAPGVEVPG